MYCVFRVDKILKENYKKHQLSDSFQIYFQTLGGVYPQQNLIQVLLTHFDQYLKCIFFKTIFTLSSNRSFEFKLSLHLYLIKTWV